MNEEQWSESLNNIKSNENRYQRNSHMTHKVDVIVGPVGWIFAICDVELLQIDAKLVQDSTWLCTFPNSPW